MARTVEITIDSGLIHIDNEYATDDWKAFVGLHLSTFFGDSDYPPTEGDPTWCYCNVSLNLGGRLMPFHYVWADSQDSPTVANTPWVLDIQPLPADFRDGIDISHWCKAIGLKQQICGIYGIQYRLAFGGHQEDLNTRQAEDFFDFASILYPYHSGHRLTYLQGSPIVLPPKYKREAMVNGDPTLLYKTLNSRL